jgi:hypothetical protein
MAQECYAPERHGRDAAVRLLGTHVRPHGVARQRREHEPDKVPHALARPVRVPRGEPVDGYGVKVDDGLVGVGFPGVETDEFMKYCRAEGAWIEISSDSRLMRLEILAVRRCHDGECEIAGEELVEAGPQEHARDGGEVEEIIGFTGSANGEPLDSNMAFCVDC